MPLKKHLFAIFTSTLLSLGIWLAILFNTDPNSTDLITRCSFFASLFVFVAGLYTFIGFYLRVYFSNREIIYSNFPIALRQSILLSLVIVGLLVFQALRVLTVWVAVIYILAIILIEFYFKSKKTN
ncbi:MAG: hypothetical protein M1338_04050 [Patescibacteria group bacterium]|nr:hypothetical protein [Patescibacteria group bacterium]